MVRKQGQAWSMDLAIGVLIFLLAVGVIYSLLNSQAREDITPLRLESEVVATKLTNDPNWKVADENTLDMEALFVLARQTEDNYSDIKTALGIEHEFCIYLVDEDGNLVYISNGTNPDSDLRFSGVGSGVEQLNISDTPCGAVVLCGNGAVDASRGEECDDGNFINGDGCDAQCRTE